MDEGAAHDEYHHVDTAMNNDDGDDGECGHYEAPEPEQETYMQGGSTLPGTAE
jgi:hypothetical protein